MINDPYTLIVCLDRSQQAEGSLYIDDEKSFEYRNGHYLYLQLEFKNDVLSSKHLEPKGSYPTKSWLERVQIAGLKHVPKAATLRSGSQKILLDVSQNGNVLTIRKPGVSMLEDWSITLHY